VAPEAGYETPASPDQRKRSHAREKPLMPSKLISESARQMNRARKTFAGGRPRSDARRCPCGVMTLKRAEARGKSSEHDLGCSFHRERAIIA